MSSCLENVEGLYGGTACSVPQQAALVSVLSIAPSIRYEKETADQGSRARIALVPFAAFPFTRKTDPETTQSLFIPPLRVHAAGRMWVRQGLLCLIETQLSSVGSSLVGRLALEFSSRWKWGSCGSCSLGDERFPRPAPEGRASPGPRVCAHPGRRFFRMEMGLLLPSAPELKLQNQYSGSD